MGLNPDDPVTLSTAAIDLLLELLEGLDPVIAGHAAWIHQDEVLALARNDLLLLDGDEQIAVVPMAKDDEAVSVFPAHPGGPLVAFDPHTGLVPIAKEQVQYWRVNVPALIRQLTADLDFEAEISPMELIPGVLWEIGMVGLGQQTARQPLWFARRLSIPDVQAKVCAVAERRRRAEPRILVTNTTTARLGSFKLTNTALISVHDALERQGSLALSADILDHRFPTPAAGAVDGPVLFRDDEGVLVLNGTVTIKFTSSRHIAAIRLLVDAYASGKRLHVRKIIGLNSGSRSLDQLFGSTLFKKLRPFLRQSNGFWWLEP